MCPREFLNTGEKLKLPTLAVTLKYTHTHTHIKVQVLAVISLLSSQSEATEKTSTHKLQEQREETQDDAAFRSQCVKLTSSAFSPSCSFNFRLRTKTNTRAHLHTLTEHTCTKLIIVLINV